MYNHQDGNAESQGDFLMARKLSRQLSTSASPPPTRDSQRLSATPRMSTLPLAPPPRMSMSRQHGGQGQQIADMGTDELQRLSAATRMSALHRMSIGVVDVAPPRMSMSRQQIGQDMGPDELRRRLTQATAELEDRDRQIVFLQSEVQQLTSTVQQQRAMYDAKVHGLKVDTLSHLIHSFRSEGIRGVEQWNGLQ